MAEECSSANWLPILEFTMRWFVALVGWGVALWLWKLRREQARRIADNTEINKAIDAALEQLNEFEELVIEFWSDPESKTLPEQIMSKMTTCVFYTMQISRLSSDRDYPALAISGVRRTATLNMEQEEREISKQKERLGRFVRLMAKLRKSDIFHKRPFSG